MENEQMTQEQQQPTYEQVMAAYSNLLRSYEQLRMELEAYKSDKLLERLKSLTQIMEHKDNYSNKILKLVEWHLEQILAKPKVQEKA